MNPWYKVVETGNCFSVLQCLKCAERFSIDMEDDYPTECPMAKIDMCFDPASDSTDEVLYVTPPFHEGLLDPCDKGPGHEEYSREDCTKCKIERMMDDDDAMLRDLPGGLVPTPIFLGKPSPDLIESDISHEDWRQYDFNGRVYHITNPKKLFIRKGGTTHRVVDRAGVTHCLPAPGTGDCVLRWYTPPAAGGPVNF